MRAVLGLVMAVVASAQTPQVELREIAKLPDVITDIQQPRGDARLFVMERVGRIRVIEGGALLAEPFLDISARVASGGERGLLGLAFPPGFATKQYFYVNYTDRQGDTTIARYRVTQSPNRADPASEAVLLKIQQPFANHNGGQIRFGPDGYLYIGMGDGGSAGDPQNNAQNPRSLLGKLLRYDSESDLSQFRIPADNPFANNPLYEPAIWALGLRNPWRFSFDRETGDQWIADVGQNRAEEINFQPAGRGGQNYGWNPTEGLQCFLPGCNLAAYTLPVIEYGRSEGCSASGGFVYRGSDLPALKGQYLYGDYCTGTIWGLRRDGDRWVNQTLLRVSEGVTTFGEDSSGEIYVGTGAGSVYRLAAPPSAAGPSVLSAVNAASFAPGLVAGSIGTVFVTGVIDQDGIAAAPSVPLPAALGGVAVTVNGRAAPLYAVARTASGEQINFQVPFEAAGAERASIVVRRGTVATAAFEAPLVAAQPGVFSADGTNAIVVRVDGNRLVTAAEPLIAGELVYFYATGLGAVTNPPATGAASPRDPSAVAAITPRVTVGGVPADVLFAGLAPDFVGLFQINIRMPAGAPSGNAALAVETGGAASPTRNVPVR
ncbi:MAG TPA: PQQ-dependent sugar dehydrogenase [Bryobacteraceae bacterium]|nr:PQQ-dependent sugar dehydrogenase [Bryobacteraceae bacterium]